jgi:HK97 family phage portal protein
MKMPKWAAKWISKELSRVPSSAMYGWLTGLGETYAGQWQTNVTTDPPSTLLQFSAIYSCVTGIAGDISKLRIKLSRDVDGIWEEVTDNPAYIPVLRNPNHYQNRIKFLEQWIVSRLLNGNAYILKQRDNRGVVNALYVLDPARVYPLITDSGDVYYEVKKDALSRVGVDRLLIPASEIIHDMMCCLWHPLVGVSPLYACALSGTMANRIQNASTGFFANRAMPGGILTAPGHISDDTAARLKLAFETNFGGTNAGRIAVLGDALKFEAMQMTAEAAQLSEQLEWSVKDISTVFHYPLFKLGGPLPPYAGNVDALTTTYYTDCLQGHIESVELCLDEGLGLSGGLHVELDLDGLIRMDTAALYKTVSDAINGGWMKPNEGRYKANLGPVAGGDTPYLQQQYWSLEQLSKRDSAPPGIDPTPEPKPEPKSDSEPENIVDEAFAEWEYKEFLNKELTAA